MSQPSQSAASEPAVPKAAARTRLPAALIPLALTYLAAALNMTVSTIALPTISTTFHASADTLAWIVNITPMASAALILFAGSLGDRFGRKRLLIIGVSVFLLSAVLSSMATSPGQLVALRGLTGVGSAIAMPAALALTFDVVAEARRRTAVGIMSATQALGSLLGPLLGGLALVTFWWGAAFLSVVPFLVLALVLNILLLPSDKPVPAQQRQSLDLPGSALTAVIGICFLYAAVTSSSGSDSARALVPIALVIGVAAVVALVWWERRCSNPLFVADIVRRRTFWVPTLAILMVQFVLGGLMFLNTQYVQLALGLSAFAAGAFLLPALLIWIASAATAGISSRKLGLRNAAAGGLLLAAGGLLLVASNDASPSYPLLLTGLALTGLMGLAPALMTHTAVDNYSAARRTVGSAINSVTQRYGLAFGVAALGGITATLYATTLRPAIEGLSSTDADRADNSLGGAIQVADSIGGKAGAALETAARDAFVTGFRWSLIVAAVLLVIVAVLVRFVLPHIGSKSTDETSQDPQSTHQHQETMAT